LASLTASQLVRSEASPRRNGHPQFQQKEHLIPCSSLSFFALFELNFNFSTIYLPSPNSFWGRTSTPLRERRSAFIYCLRLSALDCVASEPSDILPAGPAQAQHQFPYQILTFTTPALLQTHSRNIVTTLFQCGITIPLSQTDLVQRHSSATLLLFD